VRVCFVTGEYPPMQGGVGDYTRELGRALMHLGHQVVVVTSNRAGDANRAPTEDEPIVQPLVDSWNWTSWGHVLHTAHVFGSDVLHIQYQTAAYAMHPAINLLPLRLRLRRHGPAVAVTFHDLRVPYLFPKAGPLRLQANLLLARWSDAAIATNVEDYERLKQSRLPLSPHLIPIGSNIIPQLPVGYDRAMWRKRLGVTKDQILLCYFAFLNETKGGETLVRTLAELRRREHRVKLLMIGGQVGASDPTNQAYLEYINDLISKTGLAGLVLWTGYTPPDQVSANFAAADICVLPYRDGASYRRGSFMAALAHGLPIVSTYPRVAIDSLVDRENVFLVPPDDPAATADAVEGLARTPALRARLARGAKKLASCFTWDSIAKRTAQLYAELSRT